MRKLVKIMDTLESIWGDEGPDRPEDRKQASMVYMRELGPEVCAGFETTVMQANSWKIFTIRGSEFLIWHNVEEPNCSRDSLQHNYFLFDVPVTQTEWFELLAVPEEEQILHTLKWGRHE